MWEWRGKNASNVSANEKRNNVSEMRVKMKKRIKGYLILNYFKEVMN